MAALLGKQLSTLSPGCVVKHVNVAGPTGPTLGLAEGLAAVPTRLSEAARAFRVVMQGRPDVVVLVGYPDFHMFLGSRLRRAGVKTYWVGSPQFWAWGRFRLSLLCRSADRVACLFRFELEPLRRAGIAAAYFGYPLVDVVSAKESRIETLDRLGLRSDARYIVFMPGSRSAERRFHVPLYARVFAELRRKDPRLCGVMICPHPGSLPEGMISATDKRYDTLFHAEMAVIVSGTATAEAALLGVPHVVSYHLSLPTRLIAKMCVRLKSFALTNIISGSEPLVPEFLEPDQGTLVRACLGILCSRSEQVRIRTGLAQVSERLGPVGAAAAIASDILRLVGENRVGLTGRGTGLD